MKIRYANGNVSSVRNDLGRELIRAGIGTLVEADPAPEGKTVAADRGPGMLPEVYTLPTAPAPGAPLPAWATPRWNVVLFKNAFWAIQMDIGQQRGFYFGPPDQIHNKRDNQGNRYSSVFGRAVPADVLEAYKRAYKANPEQTVEDSLARGSGGLLEVTLDTGCSQVGNRKGTA